MSLTDQLFQYCVTFTAVDIFRILFIQYILILITFLNANYYSIVIVLAINQILKWIADSVCDTKRGILLTITISFHYCTTIISQMHFNCTNSYRCNTFLTIRVWCALLHSNCYCDHRSTQHRLRAHLVHSTHTHSNHSQH